MDNKRGAIRPAWLVLLFVSLTVLSGCDTIEQLSQGLGELRQYQEAMQLVDQGHTAEAVASLKAQVLAVEKTFSEDSIYVSVVLNGLSLAYLHQGKYAESEMTARRALAIAELHGYDTIISTVIRQNIANTLTAEGKLDKAEPIIRHVVGVLRKNQPDEYGQIGKAYSVLCNIYMVRKNFSGALTYCQTAVAYNRKAVAVGKDDEDPLVGSLSSLGSVYAKLHRFDDADKKFVESRKLAHSIGKTNLEAITIENQALGYRDKGEYEKAESPLATAAGLLNRLRPAYNMMFAITLYNIANNYRDEGKVVEAFSPSQESIDTIEDNIEQAATWEDSYRTALEVSLRTVLVENVRIASLLGEKVPSRAAEMAASSFRVPQLAVVSETGEAIDRMAARVAAGSGALAGAVRARQDLANHLTALDDELLAAVSRPVAQRNPSAEASMRADFEATRSRLQQADARLATAFPAYAELSARKPIGAKEVQGLLAPDEAMLVYLVDEDESWLWVVRHDQLRLLHLPIGAAALSREVTALRERLDRLQNPLGLAFPATRAYELYKSIFAPATPFLAGAHQILLVPDGALQSLPFEVLVTRRPAHDPEDTHPEENRSIAWLARDRAVTVLPSVASLRALRELAAGHHAARPFLGVGDPVLTGFSKAAQRGIPEAALFRGALADVNEVRSLPPLPETGKELHEIARILGAGEGDLYLQERASEPILRKAPLAQYRVVEFATHGLLAGQLSVPEPALVLTPPAQASPNNDGLLTAPEIATLSFNADWVVLSACNTAADDGRPDAGGLSGLAKAFFYAGSRALLVSHWEVESDVAVLLTTGTFVQLEKDPGAGRAEAFRRAEMAVLDTPTLPPRYAHPMYWAPFVLVGDNGGGPRRLAGGY